MRLLLNDVDPAVAADGDLDQDVLARLYSYPDEAATPSGRWLRANMVSTLDGAASGADGKTGSMNTEADRQVFRLLRALADVVIVGAGTARVEGYRRPRPPGDSRATLRAGRSRAPALVVVSRSANLPLQLVAPLSHEDTRRGLGDVMLATCAAAGEQALDAAFEALGEHHVMVLGEDEVDLVAMVEHLTVRGLSRMLTEGGPHLLRDMVAAGVLDELCLTVVPHVLAGEHPRILSGEGVDSALSPRLILESEGTLLGRWSR